MLIYICQGRNPGNPVIVKHSDHHARVFLWKWNPKLAIVQVLCLIHTFNGRGLSLLPVTILPFSLCCLPSTKNEKKNVVKSLCIDATGVLSFAEKKKTVGFTYDDVGWASVCFNIAFAKCVFARLKLHGVICIYILMETVRWKKIIWGGLCCLFKVSMRCQHSSRGFALCVFFSTPG